MRVQPLLVNTKCQVVVVYDATTIIVLWLQYVTTTEQLDISRRHHPLIISSAS